MPNDEILVAILALLSAVFGWRQGWFTLLTKSVTTTPQVAATLPKAETTLHKDVVALIMEDVADRHAKVTAELQTIQEYLNKLKGV